jgi:hypothetical protein
MTNSVKRSAGFDPLSAERGSEIAGCDGRDRAQRGTVSGLPDRTPAPGRNLCAKPQKAIADFTGQNGKSVDLKPALRDSRYGKHGKRH